MPIDPRPVNYETTTSQLSYLNTDGTLQPIATSKHWVDVRDYGAVCDGVTDDTVAVQAAITACLPTLKKLVGAGTCKITSSLIVDIPIGTQQGLFRIEGVGFKTTGNFPLFDSSLSYISGVHPPSCAISLSNVSVDGNPSVQGSIFSGKFLIVYTDELCTFRWIRLVNSSSYLQSWRIKGSSGGHTGKWIDVVGSYDCHFDVRMEAGSGAFFRSPSGDNAGLSFNCMYQGCTGPFIEVANIKGMTVFAYLENNAAPNFKLLSGSGVQISGFSRLTSANDTDPNFYDIEWNSTQGQANMWCSGKLENTQKILSGSAFDIAIPDNAKRITLALNGVSFTGNDILTFRMGDTSIHTTGYICRATILTPWVSSGNYVDGFGTAIGFSANLITGNVIFEKIGATWVGSGNLSSNITNVSGFFAGSKTINLSTLRITGTLGTAFDSGTISVNIE